jgi:hypothetical protein
MATTASTEHVQQRIQREREREAASSKPLGNYGLSIVLAILFLVALTLQTWMGWREFVSESTQHGEVPQWFGDNGYIWSWGLSTFENWQSEFLQLLTFVVLTAIFIHKGSHESKDTDEEMQAQLTRIEKKLEALSKAQAKAGR